MTDVDLAIVGSGFGGSLLAMVSRRLGLRVALVERGRHPRFAIGESASPLAGVLLEQLADRYDLPRVRPFSAYGTWRRAYPEVTCGLKRGFTYFKHETGEAFRSTSERTNELLVAASPHDEISDTHWYRAEFDHFLVKEAEALDVEYLDQALLDGIEWRDAGPVLTGTRAGDPFRISARAVVDATGPRGFLARSLGIGDRGFHGYPATQALFSHFVNVPRCDELPDFGRGPSPGVHDGSTSGGLEPYPADAAALHHVFDGGWMWVLRFENGIISAGCAVEPWLAAELRLADGAAAWPRFLDRFPSIRAQFGSAEAVREFTWMPQVSYRAEAAAGDRWAMLPSAAAFVDPLFSSGIPMTLVGIERLARLMEGGWPARAASTAELTAYGERTLAEADHTARFVAGCYAAFRRFDDFCSYSMLYFAAASFSEMSRRLGRTPPGFLFEADQAFKDAVTQLSPAAGSRPTLHADVAHAIDRINIAGLSDATKKHWYAADVADAIRGAWKLGATEREVIAALGAAITQH